MSKRSSNTYQNGVLVHKPEWGVPADAEPSQIKLSGRRKRAFLSKKNLKKLYKELCR